MTAHGAHVLGIDPGLAKVGWGVIEVLPRGFRYVACGCIKTSRELAHAERLLAVFVGVQRVVQEYSPQAVAVEEVFQGKNPRSAFLAGEGRSACILAAALGGLRVVEFPATVVKLAVTGNGRAGKHQVQAMVQRLLELPDLPRPHDAADALALALTFGQRDRSRAAVRRPG
ncbi:MAG: crossover junction endodeoxyribonuclease RuvC [Planctomycetota bacterium]